MRLRGAWRRPRRPPGSPPGEGADPEIAGAADPERGRCRARAGGCKPQWRGHSPGLGAPSSGRGGQTPQGGCRLQDEVQTPGWGAAPPGAFPRAEGQAASGDTPALSPALGEKGLCPGRMRSRGCLGTPGVDDGDPASHPRGWSSPGSRKCRGSAGRISFWLRVGSSRVLPVRQEPLDLPRSPPSLGIARIDHLNPCLFSLLFVPIVTMPYPAPLTPQAKQRLWV